MIHRMLSLIAFLAVVAVLPSIVGGPVEAHPRHPFSMEIVVDGVPLQVLHARGKSYIEALEGREYSVRLRNQTARRVAVALSVDGMNSIDAKTTTSRKASKWIVGPYETITIDGWQIGPGTARQFFFTTEQDSYGAWLGKTSNLGVISAAFFREKVRQPTLYEKKESRKSGDAPASGRSAGTNAPSAESESISDEHAATGIGRERDHQVRRVEFEAEPAPASVVELRYEYRDSLISLGVIPRYLEPTALERREAARGFEEFDFAPAPRR